MSNKHKTPKDSYMAVRIPLREELLFSTNKADYVSKAEVVCQPITGGCITDRRLKRIDRKEIGNNEKD